jgi:cytochrome P450
MESVMIRSIDRPYAVLTSIPTVGTALAYTHDPVRLMRHIYQQRGPVARVTLPGGQWSFALGPDAVEQALTNPGKALVSGWPLLVGPFFERGLMLLDATEHHQHRRILQHAFTPKRLAGYAMALGTAVATELEDWPRGPEVKAYPALKSLTLNLATRIFMGGTRLADQSEFDRVNAAFVACVQAGGAMVRANLPGTLWRRGYAGRAVLEEFLLRHLPAARASNGDDLFSVLCRISDDGERFTDRDVVNHMIFFLMAAHDTSTSTVSTAVRFLGQHPQWQERCREESLALGVDPTRAGLASLESLDLVIRECLRLSPPVPVVIRKAATDTEILGRPIPQGSHVAVGIALSHFMPEFWSDPERFDPDRFSPARREDKSHRFAWDPFGGGAHKCLGMLFADIEVKVILHQLLRAFRWQVDQGYRPKMNNISLPFPKDGLPVRFQRISPVDARLAS